MPDDKDCGPLSFSIQDGAGVLSVDSTSGALSIIQTDDLSLAGTHSLAFKAHFAEIDPLQVHEFDISGELEISMIVPPV